MSTTLPNEGSQDSAASASTNGDVWDRLRHRVKPLLGDLELRLGERWALIVDQIFNEVDLHVARLLRDRCNFDRQWYLVRQHLELDPNDDDEIRCAASFASAVEYLVEECRSRSSLPTSLTIDAKRGSLDLWSGGDLMFSVRPIALRRVPDASRARALGTIIGLRKFDDPTAELLQRVRRWPRMSDVKRHEATPPGRAELFPSQPVPLCHHPLPKEWLVSGALLCAKCGHPRPERSFLEKVVAAALDAPSWNHLVSASGDRTSELDGPWRLSNRRASGAEELCGFYSDAIDAVADMLSRAPNEFLVGWPIAELYFPAEFDRPRYGLQRCTGQEKQFDFPSESVEASAIRHVDEVAEGCFANDVDEALSSGSRRALEALFGIDQAEAARWEHLDAWSKEEHLATDGPWRFTTRQGSGGLLFLFARRFVGPGRCLEEVGVPVYKAGLARWRQHWVLCHEYGHTPVAIHEHLSEDTLDALSAVLSVQRRKTEGFREPPTGPYRNRRFALLVARFEGKLS